MLDYNRAEIYFFSKGKKTSFNLELITLTTFFILASHRNQLRKVFKMKGKGIRSAY